MADPVSSPLKAIDQMEPITNKHHLVLNQQIVKAPTDLKDRMLPKFLLTITNSTGEIFQHIIVLFMCITSLVLSFYQTETKNIEVQGQEIIEFSIKDTCELNLTMKDKTKYAIRIYKNWDGGKESTRLKNPQVAHDLCDFITQNICPQLKPLDKDHSA